MIENNILKLISDDKLLKALELTLEVYQYSEEVQKLVAQKGRLKGIEKLFLEGRASLKDLVTEKNKVRLFLLSFLQELEEEKETNSKICDELIKFEKEKPSRIVQNHYGEGHNIGGNYIAGDQINTSIDDPKNQTKKL